MKRIFALTILITSCVSIEYPEPKEHKRPIVVDIQDCNIEPNQIGRIDYVVTSGVNDTSLPSKVCEKPSYGCYKSEDGVNKNIYFIPDVGIAIHEYLHALGCLDHAH